jgi:hypothetical protein
LLQVDALNAKSHQMKAAALAALLTKTASVTNTVPAQSAASPMRSPSSASATSQQAPLILGNIRET